MKAIGVLSLLFVAVCLVGLINAVPVGDRLQRTFLLFENNPLTMKDAQSQGWHALNSGRCDPKFGIAYSKGPSMMYPEILYYSSAGQLAGFGLRVWDKPEEGLVRTNFWMSTKDSEGNAAWDIVISTRNVSLVCSDKIDSANGPIGDQLRINQFFPIELTAADARKSGWVSGNCINWMGIHHAYDLNKPGSQTWNVSSLVPILPMYNAQTLKISAILFWTNTLNAFEPLGPYEGPILPFIMCGNWCSNSGCHFDNITVFSTMHWMFTDPYLNNCVGAPCAFF